MVTYRTLSGLNGKTRLPRRLRGVGTERDRPGRIRTSGRLRFHGKHVGGINILREDGTVLESPAAVEEAIWQARRDVWGTAAETTPATGPLLNRYFHGRRTHFGGGHPTWEQTYGV
eukprot:57737-Lingulodinium_polyedra.AAC.1